MWGAVLASGWGTRLRSWGTIPKPITPIRGKPLIWYAARTLSAVGVDRAVVVERPGTDTHRILGALFERLLPVPNYRVWLGNAYSLSLALKAVPIDEVVVVIMGDHVIEPDAVKAVYSAAEREADHALGVDYRPRWVSVEEATKVLIENGRVVEAGKGLTHWVAVDVGVAALVNGEALAGMAERAAWEGKGFSQFMAEIRALAVDVSGTAWFDADSFEDIAEASVGRLREVVDSWERAIG